MKAIGKTTSFTFRKESENVPFFEHVRLKFAKSAYMTNKIVVKNQYGVQRNAECNSDSKFLEMDSLKSTGKRLQTKTKRVSDFALFKMFFAYNFLQELYLKPISTNLESALKSAYFDTPQISAKSKMLIFANIYQSQFESHQVLKTEGP